MSKSIKPRHNGLDYLKSLIGSLLGHQEHALFKQGHNEDADRTIFINDAGTDAMDFDAGKERIETLQRNDRLAAQQFKDRKVSLKPKPVLSEQTQKLPHHFRSKYRCRRI